MHSAIVYSECMIYHTVLQCEIKLTEYDHFSLLILSGYPHFE